MLHAADRDTPPRAGGVEDCKADFPLVQAAAIGGAGHYLDNAATTQKPARVIEAIGDCYRNSYGPIHRGLYPLADEATRLYETARQRVARFIGADAAQLVFTRSTTESINLVAHGWARPRLGPGDRVWLTRMEHHANLLPWQQVCRETGAELRVIELTADRLLDWETVPELFGPRTRLIALCQVSNVLGVENPVRAICTRAATAGIPVLVDAAQSVSHLPIDVSQLGCDFLAFSAHKMYGPSGIGALYARAEHLEAMQPLLLGGGMVDRVTMEDREWAGVPNRFEAGTQNLAGAAGFAAAVDYLEELGMERVQRHVAALSRHAVDALAAIPDLQLLTPPGTEPSGIVSFTLAGIHPHDVAQVAGDRGVALRAGHHCCQPLLQSLGLAATTRASFAVYNDRRDIEALLAALDEVRTIFHGTA